MVCTDRGRMGLVGREVGGREWRAVMEGREWGGEQGMVGSGGGEEGMVGSGGGSECLPYGI